MTINIMKLFTTLFLFLFSFYLFSQGEWLISSGGTHSDCGTAIGSDASGNIYLTGSFQGEAHFGSEKRFSNGDTDIFLAKYHSNGQLIWIKQAGSNYVKRNTITEYPTALKIHKESIYLAGVFTGIADFNGTKMTSRGKEDIFLAKYDLDGELNWVKRAGSTSQDLATDLTIDHEGNLYLTGFIQKTADFDQNQITSSHQREFFISKYSENGEVLWVKNAESKAFSLGKSIGTDEEGVLVAGEFSGNMTLASEAIDANGYTDIFLAKYDFDGNPLWISQFGSDGIENLNDLAIYDESIYLTGSYLNNSMSKEWESLGARDGFVSKLDIKGNLIWNRTIGGSGNDEASSLEITNHEIIVSGKYGSEFEFGEEIYLTNGFTDIFLLKMDKDGNNKDIKVMGGNGQDFPTETHIFNNSILVTGQYRNTLTTTTSAFGGSDMFLSSSSLMFNHEHESKVTYIVYPNPTENEFSIRSEENFNAIELISKDGRRIEFKENLDTKEFKFELSELPAGIYYIRIDGSKIKKLVVL